jgi:prepilin-type N-terminal cleavage/methylation domain-containing protein
MSRTRAYSLVELLIVVVMLGVLALVAVPRMQFGAVGQRKAQATAWRLLSALRRTRSLAILQAVAHPDGFALHIVQDADGPHFDIVDIGGPAIVDSEKLDADVTYAGGDSFQFDSLGALKAGSDTSLTVSASGTTFQVTVVPATGLVRCEETP